VAAGEAPAQPSPPPAGLTNEPVKVINKLPPEQAQVAGGDIRRCWRELAGCCIGRAGRGSGTRRIVALASSRAEAVGDDGHASAPRRRSHYPDDGGEAGRRNGCWAFRLGEGSRRSSRISSRNRPPLLVVTAPSAHVESSFQYFPGEAPSEHMEGGRQPPVSPFVEPAPATQSAAPLTTSTPRSKPSAWTSIWPKVAQPG
jgi:hypothetical protein